MIDSFKPAEAARRLNDALNGLPYSDALLFISDVRTILAEREELLEEVSFNREADRIWEETERKSPEEISADLTAAGITEQDLIEQRRNLALKISPELEKDYLAMQKENERLRAILNQP